MRFLRKDKVNKTIIVLSDLHLGGGASINNRRNPLESFNYDKELVEFLEYHSSSEFLNRDVELILNGDVFDFLAVPFVKFFDDEFWSERASLDKLKIVLEAHPEVIEAFSKFCECKKKKIVYVVGNHDAEMVFDSLQEYLLSKLTEKAREKFLIILEQNGEYKPVEGIIIQHGHEYDISNHIDFKNAFIEDELGEKYFLPPWGSYYVTRVLNKFKEEKVEIDAVRPIKKFLINGLIYDTLFALRFFSATIYYFLMVRFIYFFKQSKNLKKILKHLSDEIFVFKDYETITEDLLRASDDVKALIMGHTHIPVYRTFTDGSVFVNTGTWTDMHYLDLSRKGEGNLLTYAQIDVSDKKESSEKAEIKDMAFSHLDIALNVWKGIDNQPFREY